MLKTKDQLLKLTINGVKFFETLDAIWRKNRWNCNELLKICSKIDESLEELNPNMFFGKALGYIDHIKSWYQIEYFPF